MAGIEQLCLAVHTVSSGAEWCCTLPPGHGGPHDDGTGNYDSTWVDQPTPQQVMDALDTAGFPVRTRGRGYVRYGWPETVCGRPDLFVPLDVDSPDSSDSLTDVIAVLEDTVEAGEAARRVLNSIGKHPEPAFEPKTATSEGAA